MNALVDLKRSIDKLRTRYNMEIGKKQNLEQLKVDLEAKITGKEREVSKLEYAKLLLIETAKEARENARAQLEDIVTAALQYVFGPDFKFIIDIRETARGVAAEFFVESDQDGKRVRTNPMDARGGGVVDIIAIALQLALVQIHREPAIHGPIILDEPGKHVSEDYAVKLAMFLEEMSKQFGRQIVMVTHQAHLAQIANHAYQVEIRRGKSHVSSV
jgi:DNA repair ATPase RecN